jgi:hypothetical protein
MHKQNSYVYSTKRKDCFSSLSYRCLSRCILMEEIYHYNYIIAEDPATYAIPKIVPAYLWFSSRPDIAALRKKLILQWIFGSVQLWLLIFLMSAIYLGNGQNPNQYTRNLVVAIVDFDGGSASSFFVNAFQQTPSGSLTLNWLYKSGSDYNNNVDNTRDDVLYGRVWAIVILQPNTTFLVNNSLFQLTNTNASLTSPFTTTPAVLVTYEDGRNSFTVNNYVLVPIRSALATASALYAQAIRQQLINTLSSSPNSSVNQMSQLINTFKLESLLVNPLAATYQNLNPAFPFVGLYFSDQF